ncbi:MAG: sulfatase [Rikenellaceae bacterium]|nr:sulfatase [Rikenellaceae bacterium]
MNDPKLIVPLSLLSLVPATVGAAGKNGDSEPSINRPNIVYIMTDDHSYQMLSAYDRSHMSTPNLDRMARAGVKFTNSFVCNSISGPSRAVLLTGKHSHMNGMIDNSVVFDSTQLTFPKVLQTLGYQTAIVGKWHLGGRPAGFDFWTILPGQGNYYNPDFITPQGTEKCDGYVTNIITDKSIDWLKHRDTSRPFCLMVHHKAVHRVWMSDTTDLECFEDKVFDIPENFYDDYAYRKAAALQEMSIDKDMDLAYDLKVRNVKSRFWEPYGEYNRMNEAQKKAWDKVYGPINEEFAAADLSGKELVEWKYQRYMRDYAKAVKSLDDNVGRLLDYLEKEGLLDNTVVVYASDQGFYMGEHGWFDKRFMYEESMRTPLIMMLPPSFQRHGDVPQLVQNIDYAPTFIEMAGGVVPEEMQGVSLLPLLESKRKASSAARHWRRSLYYHYFEYPAEHAVRRHYGVRSERYKLIHFYGDDIDEWELYDLKTDPTEMQNVYDNPRYKVIREALHAELERLREHYKDDTL